MSVLGGERLRLLYPDLHGIERGKYLLGDWDARGGANFCVGVWPLTFDKEILPIPGVQFDVGLPDLEARLDRETIRPSWEPDTVIGLADTRYRGAPHPLDCRQALRDAVKPWTDLGLIPQVAFEFEFYLMEPDGSGGWRPVSLPSHRVYGTGHAIDPSGTVDDIVRTTVACGFDVEGWGSEFDTSAYEVNIRYRDALEAADDAFVFKLLYHEIAARHGMLATCLGRPIADRGGTGLHVNLSFRRADDGTNALYDPEAPDGLTGLAHQCLAGMLAHHEGSAAICAPTINAYKRLLPDMLNGYWATWGYDDRSVGIRIAPDRGSATRLENRVPDGTANPYLTTAALLHACRLGVEHELAPPPPQPTGAEPNTTVHTPPTLEAALQAFESDTELCEALGPDIVTAFTMLKQAEWKRYVEAVEDPATAEVTDWELDYYLPFY
jgi:glutamine synthetase